MSAFEPLHNLAPESATLTEKFCTRCNTTKPVDEYSRLVASPDGYHPHCRACKAAYQSGYRAARKAAVADMVQAHQGEAPKGAKTPGRLHGSGPAHGYELYRPDHGQAYYRNDGLKHIKSRGVRC